jgi:hypothetical protein
MAPKYRSGVIKVTPRAPNFDVRGNLAACFLRQTQPFYISTLGCLELAVTGITARAIRAQQKCVGVFAHRKPLAQAV